MSEADGIEGDYDKWHEILEAIIKGYDKVVRLTEVEKAAIPYVIYFFQMIFIAWVLDNKSYKDFTMRNREMLVWIWDNREKCFGELV